VSFPVVVHALEQLRQYGDEKAGQYLAAILRFEFIIALVSAEHILKSSVVIDQSTAYIFIEPGRVRYALHKLNIINKSLYCEI
jgi:hypothetical protein